jgi:hypothetical protein
MRFFDDLKVKAGSAPVSEWLDVLVHRARKAVVRLLRRPSAGPAGSASPELFNRAIDDLHRLNPSTDAYFLEIGAKLMEFLETAEAISSSLNALTVLISGERVTMTIEFMQFLWEWLKLHTTDRTLAKYLGGAAGGISP